MSTEISDPTSQNPKPDELLFKTWEQIKAFMNIVSNTYMKYGYEQIQADTEAVKWGNRIFENPKQVREIIENEWQRTEYELKYRKILMETQSILEKAGVPSTEALNLAQTYAQTIRNITDNLLRGVITTTDAKTRISNAKQNLNAVAKEYVVRMKGDVLFQDLTFPDLYSPKEVYNYAVDAALKGQWFPFVAYMADKNKLGKVNVNAPIFDIPPEDFQKALQGDRVKSKIIWENIFKVVGVAAVATLIWKGLIHLYKKYKQNQKSLDQDRLILIRLITPMDFAPLDEVWNSIKQMLGIDILQKYKKFTQRSKTRTKYRTKGQLETTEMMVKYKRQPDTKDMASLKDKLNQALLSYQPIIKTGSIIRKADNKDALPAIVITIK